MGLRHQNLGVSLHNLCQPDDRHRLGHLDDLDHRHPEGGRLHRLHLGARDHRHQPDGLDLDAPCPEMVRMGCCPDEEYPEPNLARHRRLA